MSILRAAGGELRIVWRVLRVLGLFVLFAIVLALGGGLVHVPVVSRLAVHGGAISAVAVCMALERLRPAAVGLERRRGWVGRVLLGIGWGALSIGAVVAGMTWITGELDPARFFAASGARATAAAIAYFALVAVGEELLFRGYLITVLRSRLGAAPSVVLAAVAFAAIHVVNPSYGWFAFVYALLIGILLGAVFVRGRSLWIPLGFHFAWNALQSEALFAVPERGGELPFAVVLLADVAIAWWAFGRGAGAAGDDA